MTTDEAREPAPLTIADEQLLRELTERARVGGLKLTGEGGLLGKLTKMATACTGASGRRGPADMRRAPARE